MLKYFRFLIVLYRALIVRTDGYVFAVLFNFKSRVISSPARVKWDGETFKVTDKSFPNLTLRVRSPLVLNMAFEFGLEARANSLGSSYFLSAIEFEDGDVIIDCGANVGDLLLWFRFRQIDINYLGFEPAPIEYELCQQNVEPHKVHNIALWHTNGKTEFFISSRHADSSLIQPKSYNNRIMIETARLEDFVSGPIKCLKLEAEGAEPEILEGLLPKLHMVEYVTADLGFERGVKEESTLAPVVNTLLANNFELLQIGSGRLTALFRNKAFQQAK